MLLLDSFKIVFGQRKTWSVPKNPASIGYGIFPPVRSGLMDKVESFVPSIFSTEWTCHHYQANVTIGGPFLERSNYPRDSVMDIVHCEFGLPVIHSFRSVKELHQLEAPSHLDSSSIAAMRRQSILHWTGVET
ncbi:hypothetical protein IV203_010830 [Nitzschia inconspicua]|uniref:Uncharacterized protein n=1 Tax=Nitzschia inconspicua TaxID=303405 RepID=A0A9K3KWU7_9STRA|nr:hypothetical protein IV203_010830 [Nitzschia inconspicua]